MIARAPLSPRLSITWMLLIAGWGVLLRFRFESKEAYEEKGTLFWRILSWEAAVLYWTIVPISIAISLSVALSMLFGVVYSFMAFDVILIPLFLICVCLIKYPIEAMWGFFDCASEEADTEGFDHWFHKVILHMSEGPTFKYWFLVLQIVFGVAIQNYIAFEQLNYYADLVGREHFDMYVAQENGANVFTGVPAKIYYDFFMLSSLGFPALDIDYWTDWRLGMPPGITDLVLTFSSKISFSVAIFAWFTEKIINGVLRLMVARCQKEGSVVSV